MEERLKKTVSLWEEMTRKVLNLEEITANESEALIKESHLVLKYYHQAESVPKEVVKLFLEMKDYLYFSSLMEEKEKGEGYYHFFRIASVVKAMEEGFFRGKYPHDLPNL